MMGAKISAKFPSSSSTWHDFMFKGFGRNAKSSQSPVQSQPEPDLGVSPPTGLFAGQPILDEDIVLGDRDEDDSD